MSQQTQGVYCALEFVGRKVYCSFENAKRLVAGVSSFCIGVKNEIRRL
jgi:hypothetical protein